MRTRDDIEFILDLAFSDAKELERLARQFRMRKLTAGQFTTAVEDISSKLRQAIIALMEEAGMIAVYDGTQEEDDVPNEDIPF